MRRRDHEDLADPGEHERAQRVEDHRLVVDREQLLGDDPRHRVQPRARPAGQDDALPRHSQPASPFGGRPIDAASMTARLRRRGRGLGLACGSDPFAGPSSPAAGAADRSWTGFLRGWPSCPARARVAPGPSLRPRMRLPPRRSRARPPGLLRPGPCGDGGGDGACGRARPRAPAHGPRPRLGRGVRRLGGLGRLGVAGSAVRGVRAGGRAGRPVLALLARAARLGRRIGLLLGQVRGERGGELLDVGAELGARRLDRARGDRIVRQRGGERGGGHGQLDLAQRGHEQARPHVVLLAARGGERAQQVADRRAGGGGRAVLRLPRGARELPRPGQPLRLRAGQRAGGDRRAAAPARPARGRSPRSAPPRSGAPCGRSC